MTAQHITAIIQAAEPPKRRLTAVSVAALLARDIKPREMLLSPVVPEKGLAMVYAKRGVGKTFVALGIAFAVATGSTFLRWRAARPRRTLFIDGEMPLRTLQERLASIALGSEGELPSPDYLQIIAADDQEFGIPDLSTREGQDAIEEHLADGYDLVVVDNLSTLCRGGKENEGESWLPVQEWALQLRRRGISVVFVHHAGKAGAQRGTSRREDVLDTVIVLRQPDNYTPDQGARFEIHLEKARGVHGEEAKPFEAQLEIRNDAAMWTTSDLADVQLRMIAELTKDGLSVREIADETGIPRSTVSRMQTKARQLGLVP